MYNGFSSSLRFAFSSNTKSQLEEICDLVLEENAKRNEEEKPLYIMYDQIYCALTYGSNQHYDPVSLRPQLRPYTIFVDGLSKSFAATGIRVGWSMGPTFIIDKMKSILSHIGAWAPKAEQVASAKFMTNAAAVDAYMKISKKKLNSGCMLSIMDLHPCRKKDLKFAALNQWLQFILPFSLI